MNNAVLNILNILGIVVTLAMPAIALSQDKGGNFTEDNICEYGCYLVPKPAMDKWFDIINKCTGGSLWL